MQLIGRNSVILKALKKRVRKRPAGEVVVDGRRLVDDLVRWRVPIRELYISRELPDDEIVGAWIEAADKTWVIHESVFDSVAPTRSAQGVLAVVEEPAWPKRTDDESVILYLEGVQDPGNLGAIIRSAAALGGHRVALSHGCADPFHSAAVRGSAGAVFRVPIERGVSALDLIAQVRISDGEAWAAGGGGVEVREWRPKTPTVLFLGAEGAGLDRQTVEAADGIVTIPLDNEVESLNVAVAAGILLEHLR